jgi:hypothetical protein
MSTTHEVVAGQTSAYDIDLKDDGATPSGTLAGTVTWVIKNAAGTQITMTGNVTIQNAATWRVRVLPDSGDFVEGIYRCRIKVTDDDGKVAYFPSAAWDRLIVHAEA